ncbi:MAG: MarR family winged helix-turn-helix transcriptional regulator [Candidatus Dormibacteria bacterium]
MSSTKPEPDRLRTWRAFLESHVAVVGRLEDELQNTHHLSLAGYEVLLRLAEAPGGRLRMHDLVSCALMTKSGVTRLVDRMEAEGLLCRESCPSDRRGAYAVLTPEGRHRLRRAAPTHLEGIEEHFTRHLSDEEAAAMDAALKRIRAALPGRRPIPGGCDGSAALTGELLSGQEPSPAAGPPLEDSLPTV